MLKSHNLVCLEIEAYSFGQCLQFDALKKFNDFKKSDSKAFGGKLKQIFERFERVSETFDRVIGVSRLELEPFSGENEEALFEAVL